MRDFLEAGPETAPIRKRRERNPTPGFIADITKQESFGFPAADVTLDEKHEARKVRASVERLDLKDAVAKYSSLGTKGYHPSRSLAVWIYASQLGIHHSTALAQRLETDVALRWLAGGHLMSEGHLRKFRRENRALFEDAIRQTVALASQDNILNTKQMAVDGVRLRAEASTSAVRTVLRSKKRLASLEQIDVATLSEEQRRIHDEKLAKHREALRLCDEADRSNVVLTNPSAGLMKFPNGASAPGHRVTATVAGKSQRFIVDVFVDASSCDAGHLRMALMRARQVLQQTGVPLKEKAGITADAGYLTHDDLRAADEASDWADVLINVPEMPHNKSADGKNLFSVDDFKIENKTITCPAGTLMKGPLGDGPGQSRWAGVGCATCPMKTRCTTAKVRTVTLHDGYVQLRKAMKAKLETDEGKARYKTRIATVEPAFSHLEDVWNYRRVSSRLEEAAIAEIMLKVLAYNLYRLRTAKRVSRVQILIELADDGFLHFRFPAAAPYALFKPTL